MSVHRCGRRPHQGSGRRPRPPRTRGLLDHRETPKHPSRPAAQRLPAGSRRPENSAWREVVEVSHQRSSAESSGIVNRGLPGPSGPTLGGVDQVLSTGRLPVVYTGTARVAPLSKSPGAPLQPARSGSSPPRVSSCPGADGPRRLVGRPKVPDPGGDERAQMTYTRRRNRARHIVKFHAVEAVC